MAVLSKVANIAVQPQPVGVVEAFAGTNAPNGWLICDGSQISRALYPELFNVIGTTYGSGDGFATFTLPDLRGRTIAGRDGVNNMNNGPTNRLTSTFFGASGTALGNSGGSQSNTLTSNEMPSHTHTQNAHSHSVESPGGHSWGANFGGLSGGATFTFSPSGVFAGVYGGQNLTAMGVTATNQNTGGGNAHNNTQPTIILNYIIKAVSELPRGGWYNSSTPEVITSLPTNPYEGQEVYLQETVAGTTYQTAKRYSAGTWYNTGAVSKPSWVAPTLINGWANHGAGFDTAGYLKTPDGIVMLKGLLSGSSKTSDIAFVLPTGFRPSARKLFPATSGEPWTVSRIDVDTSGNVYAYRTGNTWVGLDGVSFYAEV
jgi:microcystin-dependent protein